MRDPRVAVGPLPAHVSYADLATALAATIPRDARVLGFGELHVRTDRPPSTSALAQITRALPAFAANVSDLVVETWLTPPTCGDAGARSTARVEATVKRPPETRSEVGELAETARRAGIQPHAMTITCADLAVLAPTAGEVDVERLLTITTRELTRIATSAVAHRAKRNDARPWIALYGGALHNDRFPEPGVVEWSYAAAIDRATGGHYVEIDLIAPALAAADPASQRQPWFPLTAAPPDPQHPVRVWQRGERSFVVVLPP